MHCNQRRGKEKKISFWAAGSSVALHPRNGEQDDKHWTRRAHNLAFRNNLCTVVRSVRNSTLPVVQSIALFLSPLLVREQLILWVIPVCKIETEMFCIVPHCSSVSHIHKSSRFSWKAWRALPVYLVWWTFLGSPKDKRRQPFSLPQISQTIGDVLSHILLPSAQDYQLETTAWFNGVRVGCSTALDKNDSEQMHYSTTVG